MASQISRELSYYLASAYYTAKSFFVYRAQAWMWMLQALLALLLAFVSVTVIYSVSSGIAGWSYYQLLFLTYLTALTVWAIAFVANPWEVPYVLRTGQLDSYMTRPFSVLAITFANSRSVSSLFSGVFGSLAFLTYASLRLQLSPLLVAEFVPLYLLGLAALTMFTQALAVLSYKLMKSGFFINQAMTTMQTLSNYPLSAYGGTVQLLCTVFIPIGIAVYYPVEFLLGDLTAPVYLALVALSVAAILVFYWLFNRLMRSYESGGG